MVNSKKKKVLGIQRRERVPERCQTGRPAAVREADADHSENRGRTGCCGKRLSCCDKLWRAGRSDRYAYAFSSVRRQRNVVAGRINA